MADDNDPFKYITYNPIGSDRTGAWSVIPLHIYENGDLSKRQFKKMLKEFDNMRRGKINMFKKIKCFIKWMCSYYGHKG